VAGVSDPQPADGKVVVDEVGKRFRSGSGTVEALRDVNFAVEDGEFVCIVGASGAGKTTLFRIIAGLESATEGTVWLDGDPVTEPGTDRGMVFQEYALFPWRTVLGNVTFGLEQRDMPKADREARAREMLELVGLEDVADSYPKALSGGMKQRVGIARALAVDPELLLMDEPFGSLDAQTRETLHAELLDIWSATGKTVLFVTHDVSEAVTLADRIVVMTDSPGRVGEVVDVDLPRPRERTDEGFAAVYDRVRSLIAAGDEPGGR